jgi:hypothetical protein
MLIALVLLLWALFIGGPVFHYRNLRPVRNFRLGFQAVWYSVLFAKEPPESWEPEVGEDIGFGPGVVFGMWSVAVVIALLIIALCVLTYYAA